LLQVPRQMSFMPGSSIAMMPAARAANAARAESHRNGTATAGNVIRTNGRATRPSHHAAKCPVLRVLGLR
jgi:hypothetical protein